MAGITHSKVSAVADSADTTLARPSDWNADHSLGTVMSAPYGAGLTLTFASVFCTGDVTMTTANTFYAITGVSVSLVAGSYLVWFQALVAITNAGLATVKIWDGTTAYGSAEFPLVAGNSPCAGAGCCSIVLASTKTIAMQITTTAANNVAKATVVDNGTGLTNMATGFVYLRAA